MSCSALIINKMNKEQADLKLAQSEFIRQMNEYLVNGPLKLSAEGANVVTRNFVVSIMRGV
jgi:hypothetical protein